jgi:16S rRNA (cytidine1402-2'-O)-methyltransferase
VSATLYAIPAPLGGKAADALPVPALATIRTLRTFAVENAKTARAFLSDLGMPCPIRELRISVLEEDVSKYAKLLRSGHSLGLLSEAGCPAIADPRVVPLVGPSSIVLALMASGLEGQRFAFCGYLPREPEARRQRIRELEVRSRRERETQIFIETPYRNDALLAALLQTAADTTRLCVAADLTLPGERIRTHAMPRWRSLHVEIGKRPAVFLLQAASS